MSDPSRLVRPVIMGMHYMVSAGHHLAAAAGARILDNGGNAVDAGVAAGLCTNVVQADQTNVGGVAPICIYRSDSGNVETISGLGCWPAAVDVDFFHKAFHGRIPRGVHRSVVPSAMDAWLTALQRHGTMTLREVMEPAIELAEDGFPMYDGMAQLLSQPANLRAIQSWPSTRTVFCEGGRPIPVGRRVRQPDLAHTLRLLGEAERGAATREAGIRAARERFYKGDIAEAIVRFAHESGGWLDAEDLANFHVEVERPERTTYRGYEIDSCGFWCQGPVVLEALNILEGYNLSELEPSSPQVLHLVIEALKAAFADRDRYYGDPRHVRIPADGLLSKEYAQQWRQRIDRSRSSPGMPMPGNAWRFSARPDDERPSSWKYPSPSNGALEPDTSYLCVVDSKGDAFSATPSDGVTNTPIVPGLGIIISSRGMQSWLDPNHPSSIAPGKRPRLTPCPGMVLKEGRLVMPYGTPGNDVQPQAMVQFLLNVIDFGMNVQQAVEAPRCATYSFPASSDPHPYWKDLAYVEDRVDQRVVDDLRGMGHDARLWPAWSSPAGSLGAIWVDHEHEVLHAATDPRRAAHAIGR